MPDKKHPLYQEDIQNILLTQNIDQLNGKTVLITGATGLIGTQLVDALMALGNVKVVAVGRNEKRARERFGEYFGNEHFRFLAHDVCQTFATDLHTDFIIPLASNTHPLAYSQYPIETMLVNIWGTQHALDLALRCNATMLCSSTVEIYGNARNEDIFTEEYTGNLNLQNSRSCYAEAKRTCEAMCQSYIAEKSAKVKIGRLCRVFGPTVLADDSKASSQFIKKALASEDIVLKSKGNQYFSYIYVADAASALLHIMLNGEMGKAYNIANEQCNVHLRDFAEACATAVGKKVVFDLPSEAESKGYSIATQAIMDNSRLLASGWQPKYDFGTAVERTIEILKG